MKFTCAKNTLIKALNITMKAVSSRTTIPVLKGILIEAADNGKITLSASDESISIIDTIEGDIKESGSVVVMAKLFNDIIRKLPGNEIEIISNDTTDVIIRSMKSEFKILGTPAEEFPTITAISGDTRSIRFNKNMLKSMIEKTAFAASVDEGRGVITGVLIEIADGDLTMAAIDGYRMAINRDHMITEDKYSFIIPAKILTELSKILSESSGEEEGILYLEAKKAAFIFDNIQAELSLLAGQFVDYKGILPKASRIQVTADREMLKEAIERASILSSAGKNNLIRLKITDNVMEITSTSEEGGVKDDVLINKKGEDLVIGFNAHYLRDALNAVEDEQIRMDMNSPVEPCMIRPVDGDSFEYLVLPVRIN